MALRVSPAKILKLKTGTYTGDGTLSKAITGVGFKPIVLNIYRYHVDLSLTEWFTKTDKHYLDMCNQDRCVATAEHYAQKGVIITLDEDGFTVGDGGGDLHPNKNAYLYIYVAWGY